MLCILLYLMAKEYNPVVSLRIPLKLVEKMDRAIITGMYRNRADYVMAALRVFDDGVEDVNGGGGKQLPCESEGSDGGMKDGQ